MPGTITNSVMEIPLRFIEPDPNQPRKTFDEDGIKELATSMTAMGQRTAIEIRPHADSTKRKPRYIIIAGERRWRAATMLGWESMKAIVYRDISEHDAVMSQLLENIVRRDLDPVEKATAYQRMMDEGYSAKDIGDAVGTTAANVVWFTKLLEAAPEVIKMVQDGEIKAMTAVFVSKLSHAGQVKVIQAARKSNLTTREIELLCNRLYEQENSEEVALFNEGLLTEVQRESLKSFEDAFGAIQSNLNALLELEKEHSGSLGQSLANPALVESQIDEVIKGLNQVRNSLRVNRMAEAASELAED